MSKDERMSRELGYDMYGPFKSWDEHDTWIAIVEHDGVIDYHGICWSDQVRMEHAKKQKEADR